MLLVTVAKNESLFPSIQEAIRRAGITSGALTLIGAVDYVMLSVMHKTDPSQDLFREYDQPMEMHGVGEIKDGNIHLHATFAGEDIVVAGHVHHARVENFFVNVYLAG